MAGARERFVDLSLSLSLFSPSSLSFALSLSLSLASARLCYESRSHHRLSVNLGGRWEGPLLTLAKLQKRQRQWCRQSNWARFNLAALTTIFFKNCI